MLGLYSPLLRWMMSGAQTKANKSPVNSMGVGVQSTAQRKASGNKAIKAGGREAKAAATAKRGVTPPGLKKKKGKAKGRLNVLPDPVPVVIPVGPDEEELGLAPPS